MASRQRTTSSQPKPPANLDPTCVISDAAVLVGIHPITIGANAVLHPRSKINSTFGPVLIGPGCIICERGSVGLLQEADLTVKEPAVELQENVILEPAAVVEAAQVGTGSVLEAGSKVGVGAVIGKHCRVTPLCSVEPYQALDDFTIVYGDNHLRHEKPGLEGYRLAAHEKQLEVLRRLIPSSLAKWQQDDR